MNKVYLVSIVRDDYDSNDWVAYRAFFLKELADQCRNDIEALISYVKSFKNNLNNSLDEFNKQNPPPNYSDIPSYLCGNIYASYSPIVQEYNRKYREWAELFNNFRKDFIKKNYNPPKHLDIKSLEDMFDENSLNFADYEVDIKEVPLGD